ncbi:GNAT family N-acetyltransferase, partial [Kistimonas scapharcae]|uniref:GNAT family N-acetyltransferase n=1 Tax=Kistimonas scapharcae TaxID=1036133 RepID=UPI0031ED3E06
ESVFKTYQNGCSRVTRIGVQVVPEYATPSASQAGPSKNTLNDRDISILISDKRIQLLHLKNNVLLTLRLKFKAQDNLIKLKLFQASMPELRSFADLYLDVESKLVQLQYIQTNPAKHGLGTLLLHIASFYAVHIKNYPIIEVRKAVSSAFGFYRKLGFEGNYSVSPTYLQITSKALLENTRHICQKFHAITDEYSLCPQATMTSWKSLPVLP